MSHPAYSIHWMGHGLTTACESRVIKDIKWFEPGSISSLSSVIVKVSVALKRTVGDSD